MVSVTHQTIAAGTSLGHVTRPARALIGWMSQEEAQLTLAGRLLERAHEPALQERALAARNAAAARAAWNDEPHILEEPGPELVDYVNRFVAQPDFQQMSATGWSVKIANLSKVIALQPMVFWDHAQERTQPAVVGDMVSVAQITLPIRTGPETLPLQYDPSRNTWMVTSRNPNLRIAGHFNAPIDVGGGRQMTVCGFIVSILPSFVQVVRYRNRLILRDGYHRSLGLLAQGVTHVSVAYKDFEMYEPLGLGPGMLPEASYLGDRPALLADYLNDAVSAEISQPASQKMIVVQGIEMNPMG